MKTFEYKIKDALGIHARPAGMLAKAAKEFQSKIIIEKAGKQVEATKLMALMGMAVKCGETVKVTIEGADEAQAFTKMQAFFKENL